MDIKEANKHMMDKIIWEKEEEVNKKNKKKRDKIFERVGKEKRFGIIDKDVIIGFNANQFIVRLPREISKYLKLKEKKAKDKKYKFKIILDTSKNKSDDKKVTGGFEIIKNE